jgi:hypothetical protein
MLPNLLCIVMYGLLLTPPVSRDDLMQIPLTLFLVLFMSKLTGDIRMVHIQEGRVGSSDNSKTRVSLLDLFQGHGKNPKFDVEIQDCEGKTALHYAVANSEAHTACLIEARAKYFVSTNDGRNLLHIACAAQQSNIVGLLLAGKMAKMVNVLDHSGRSPLHVACTSGRPETVHYLIKYGANIHPKDDNESTPLHYCAIFVSEKPVWSTVLSEAEEAAKDLKMKATGFVSKTQYLFRPSDHNTSRISGIIKMLLSSGADINAQGAHGLTPLGTSSSDLVMTRAELGEAWCS